ncbi:hypothetical protein LTR66_015470, partial [Elasticomyces elasticus]
SSCKTRESQSDWADPEEPLDRGHNAGPSAFDTPELSNQLLTHGGLMKLAGLISSTHSWSSRMKAKAMSSPIQIRKTLQDFKPTGDPLSEDEEVDSQEIINTDDFPGYAGPIDLKALPIKAESHLMSCSTSGNAEETEVSEDSSSNDDSDDWPFPEFRHVSQSTRGPHRSHHLLNNEAKVGKHAATIPTETSTNDHIPE